MIEAKTGLETSCCHLPCERLARTQPQLEQEVKYQPWFEVCFDSGWLRTRGAMVRLGEWASI
jgi:hypothetical protein